MLKDGIKRWHVYLWHLIVKAALDGAPDKVTLNHYPSLKQSVINRYGANSPEMLRWFRTYNLGKPYPDQVKPFGFLLSFALLRSREKNKNPMAKRKISTAGKQ